MGTSATAWAMRRARCQRAVCSSQTCPVACARRRPAAAAAAAQSWPERKAWTGGEDASGWAEDEKDPPHLRGAGTWAVACRKAEAAASAAGPALTADWRARALQACKQHVTARYVHSIDFEETPSALLARRFARKPAKTSTRAAGVGKANHGLNLPLGAPCISGVWNPPGERPCGLVGGAPKNAIRPSTPQQPPRTCHVSHGDDAETDRVGEWWSRQQHATNCVVFAAQAPTGWND